MGIKVVSTAWKKDTEWVIEVEGKVYGTYNRRLDASRRAMAAIKKFSEDFTPEQGIEVERQEYMDDLRYKVTIKSGYMGRKRQVVKLVRVRKRKFAETTLGFRILRL